VFEAEIRELKTYKKIKDDLNACCSGVACNTIWKMLSGWNSQLTKA